MSKERDLKPLVTRRIVYFGLSNTKLHGNYVIRKGFLCKGNIPATLVTSGIVEAAAQGFLQVDDPQEYETG
ncbi:hypothetical protein [Desulfitobacterium hafniense]|uniref:hypothetical protein n=1 Tax=Desulfitobacterium hafniense TaxID=49338 RepID=UPI0002D77664|nr:hypothetical protein [Desulfitobacterium hafniense]